MTGDLPEQIHVYIADSEDSEDLTFDGVGDMPILRWHDHDIEHRMPGWRLDFEEPDGNGVESEFTAMYDERQVEEAVAWARGVIRYAQTPGDSA